ncbi:MbnP family protein [Flavobacterium sp.]|uniref:MbnP family protein n=1 Tax=Flavobacterium sp. TaxID=239 RepID=UPI0025EBDDB9|nr:MbnP family protein [Flavobacterium sp.]
MTKAILIIIASLLFCLPIHSQSKTDSLAINFHLEFNKLPLEINKKYVSANKDTLTVETFRCYVSNIQIQYKDNSVFTQKNSYYLLDSEHPNSFQIPITKKTDKQISKITFNIGIDSLTNTAGAMAGDLDPVKGMYWAWQSGYINMKIEGKSSSCKTRKNEFQFHVGGYLQPYYAMRQMKFTLDKKANDDINIGIDLFPFFSNVELKETNSVMIPGNEAMKLANYSCKMFYIQ